MTRPKKDMTASIIKSARTAARDGRFEAMARAALKARVSRSDRGDIIDVDGQQFLVDEDDRLGMVVQMVMSREELDGLSSRAAQSEGIDLSIMEPAQAKNWIDEFSRRLEESLRQNFGISLKRTQAGITFEMLSYKSRDASWRDGA